MNYLFINSTPVNVWPPKLQAHLRDVEVIEDVEYEDITESDEDVIQRPDRPD